MPDRAFAMLFDNSQGLTDASGLVLDSDTLTTGCYSGMFVGCTSLTSAPTLPATTLAAYCYSAMFMSCYNLTTAPALTATTLPTYCYNQMFKNCQKLSSVEVAFDAWPSGTIGSNYPTYEWLSNVAPSGNFICPSGLEYRTGTSYIPEEWLVNGEKQGELIKDPLTIKALEAGSTVRLSKFGALGGNHDSGDAVNDLSGVFEYSTDNGNTWNEYSFSDTVEQDTYQNFGYPVFRKRGQLIILANFGDKVMFRGNNEVLGIQKTDGDYSLGGYNFEGTGKLAAEGNAMSLLNKFKRDNIPGYCFQYMFTVNDALYDASDLYFEATGVKNEPGSDNILYYAFGGCSNLATIPQFKIPQKLYLASTFRKSLGLQYVNLLEIPYGTNYQNAFRDCANLTGIVINSPFDSNVNHSNWLKGLEETTGTLWMPNWFIGNITTRGANTVPSGWTIEPVNVPLTFIPRTGGTIALTKTAQAGSADYSGVDIEYSTNNGSTWTKWALNSTINVTSGNPVKVHNAGTSLGNFVVNDSGGISIEYGITFGGTATYDLSGNIMSLVDRNMLAKSRVPNGAFNYMFLDNRNVRNLSGLLLPASDIGAGGLHGTFQGCTSVTSLPKALPARKVRRNGCHLTFYQTPNSTNLVGDIPALEGKLLGYRAYASFCSGLKGTAVGNAISVRITDPEPVMIDTYSGKWEPFYQAFRKTTGPATLYAVTVNWHKWPTGGSNSSTQFWMDDTPASGNFRCPADLVIPSRDYNGVPEGWTIVDSSSEPNYLTLTAEEANSTVALTRTYRR